MYVPCSNSQAKGFSLVEVTLALGVLAFSLITLITVASLGFSSSKDSTADTRTSTIANQVYQKVRTELCTAETFATPPVATWQGSPPHRDFWFDDQGAEWTPSTSTGRTYRARAIVVPHLATNAPVGLDAQILKALVIKVEWPVDPSTGEWTAQGVSTQQRIFSLLLRNPGYKGNFP